MLQLVEDLDIGEFLTDGVLYSNVPAGLANAPDASFLKWETTESGRVRLIARRGVEGQITEIQGPPDWVMEMVSHSSVGKDTRDLRIRYRRAGIPEYWLIDARGADIDFQDAGAARQPLRRRPAARRLVRLAGFRPCVPPRTDRNRAGRWQYKLHHRPA